MYVIENVPPARHSRYIYRTQFMMFEPQGRGDKDLFHLFQA